mgnify:CR=1 FL=1
MALYQELIPQVMQFWTERIAEFSKRYLGVEPPDTTTLAREFEAMLTASDFQRFEDTYGAEEAERQVARVMRRQRSEEQA